MAVHLPYAGFAFHLEQRVFGRWLRGSTHVLVDLRLGTCFTSDPWPEPELITELMDVVSGWAGSSRRLGLQGRRRRTIPLAAHRQILEAITIRDPQAAQHAMAEHITDIRDLVAKELSS